jgi:hypothetical protein
MKTEPINIALFDMDGSIADYSGALVRDLHRLAAPGEPEITRDSLWQIADTPHIAERIHLIKSQPGWWQALDPIPEGMAVLDWCRRGGFDVHVLTKGPRAHSQAWAEKVRWCQQHLGKDADIHVTSDKGLVYGKILYDDYPEYMLRWLAHRPRGLGILPDTPSNRGFTPPNVIRYRGPEDMDAVIRALEACLKRAPGRPLLLG